MNWSIIWLVALIAFALLEAISIGLVSIWFGIGALVALLASFFITNPWIQLAIFLVVSLVALLAIRPLARKYMTPKQVATNVDRLIGMQAVVLEEVNSLTATGTVKVSGVVWSVRTEDKTPIPVDSIVFIHDIQGAKLVVSLNK